MNVGGVIMTRVTVPIANYKYVVGETDMKGHLHNLIKIARKALQDTKE